jgi:predicted AlkP superfamily phosphohydrolase/phosphomutase
MIGGELPRLTLYRLLELRRRLPKGLRDFAKQRAPMLRDRVHELKEFTAVDFQRTRAFAYGNMGNIVINLRGREKFGIVEKGDEYDRLCEDIRAQALELRHPETGDQLIVAVHRRDELFEGPELERIPDLIVEFDHYAWAGKGNLMKATPMFEDIIKMPDSGHEHYVGTHRHEGIIGFRGKSAQEAKIAQANIQDVAPTIMYLLGEKVPIQMEGRVLEEMLDPTLLADRSIDYADADAVVVGIREAENYSPDELDEVESRLRNLGYLE